ncbi:hypothetical protein RAS1_30950 [Phycisphaerae bacterium RAS1]|nr:hypothetical protein RAS1_30950 [Phycisphaerae bacterium RAS1]
MAKRSWKAGIGLVLGICVGCGDFEIPPISIDTGDDNGPVNRGPDPRPEPPEPPPPPSRPQTRCTPVCDSYGYCDSDCDGWFDEVEIANGYDACDWYSPDFYPEWDVAADICDSSRVFATARVRESDGADQPTADEMAERRARQLEALTP